MPGPREIEGVYFKVRADVKEAMDDLARLNQAKAQAGTPVGGGGGGFGGSGGGWGASGATPPNWGASGGAVSFGFGHGSAVGVGNALGGGIGPVWGTGPFGGGGTPFQSQFGSSMQAINNQWLATQSRQASVGASILGMEQRAFAMQGESIRTGAQSANDQWLADNARRQSVSSSILGMERSASQDAWNTRQAQAMQDEWLSASNSTRRGAVSGGIMRMEQEGHQSQFRSEGADYYRRQSVGNEIMRMEGVDAGYRQQNDYYARQGAQYQADSDEDAMNRRLMAQQGGLFGKGGLFGTGVGRSGTGFGKYIALHAGIGGLAAAGRASLDSDAYTKDVAAAVTPEEQAQVALGAAGNRSKYLSSVPWIGGLAATAHEMWQEFALGDSQRDVVRDEGLSMRGINGQQSINDARRQLRLTAASSFDPGSSLSAQVRERTLGRADVISAATKPYNDQILQGQADRRNEIAKLGSFFSTALVDEAHKYGINTGNLTPDQIREQLLSKSLPDSTAIKAQRDAAGVAAGANVDRQNAYQTGQIGINTQYMGDLTNKGSITAEYNKALREATNALKNAGDADKVRVAEETNYSRVMAQRTRDSGMIGVAGEINSIMGGAGVRSLEASGRGMAAERASAALSVDSAKYAFAQALISKDPERIRIAGAGLGGAIQDQSSTETSIARRTAINSTNIWGQISASEARLFGGGDYQAQLAGISANREQMMEQRGQTGLTPGSINRLADLQGQEAQRTRQAGMAHLNIEGSKLTSQLVAAQQFGRRNLVGSATTTAIGEITEQAHLAQSAIEQQNDPELRSRMGRNAVTALETMKQNAVNRYRGGIAMAESPYEAQVKGYQATSAPPNLGELIPVINTLIQTIQNVTPKVGTALSLFQ